MKITIDDFKPGATAYVMGFGESGWAIVECDVMEVNADKINKPPHYIPYVVIVVRGATRKCQYWKSPDSPHFYSFTGFTNNGTESREDWEWPLLFPTIEAAKDYQEVHEMQWKAARALAQLSIARMGKDKLRALLDVLEGAEIW